MKDNKNKENTKNRNNKKDKDRNKKVLLWIIIALSLVIFGTVVYTVIKERKDEDVIPEDQISYTDLIKQINDGNVEKIKMTVGSTTIKVNLKEQEEPKTAIVPSTQAFIELVQEKVQDGNEITLIQEKPSVFLSIADKAFSILPTILMLVLFVLLIQMQGLGDKGKVYEADEDDVKTTFDDVAGLDEEKQEMIEIVNFLKNPDEFYKMGAKIPKGVLLCGQPGTGKTLIAKAIAGEADVPFISMSGSEFTEMFAGLGASRVRKLFDKAKKMAPAIIFIDEIDAVGRQRGAGLGGGHDEREQTLNQLLVEMDGFGSNEGVIVLAATNRPDVLDKALLRPGRFDRQIVVSAPDVKAREQILEVHSRKKKIADDVDLKTIAKNTAGFSGADLENVLNEAALLAARRDKKEITMAEIEDAMVKVTMGPEKKSRVRSEKENKLVAFHEAGHAVVSKFLPTQDTVHQISIVPRGMAGGYTMYKPDEDKNFMSKTEMEETIISLLGGRVAEQLVLNDISTGASNDIERASKIARDMVTRYGMSDKIGTITFGSGQEEVFLGRDLAQTKNFSEETAAKIDEEVKRIIDEAYNKAKTILSNNMDKLSKVAQVLLEKEKIDGDEFAAIFEE